jgi:hypothetical protein
MTGRPPEEQAHEPSTGRTLPPPGIPARLAAFLSAVLQPAPGMRPASARAARLILDGGYVAGPQSPAPPGPPGLSPERERRQRWLYRGITAVTLAATALLHTVYFNSFSETELVQMAPFWVTPLAFGISGLIALPRRHSLALAFAGAVVGFLGLVVFLFGIFPSL